MTDEPMLYAKIDYGHDFFQKNIPDCIIDNLNPKFELRPYQLEAFGRFQYYVNDYPGKEHPIQLLYHMATGSGKTLIMAGLILYLYEQGYRNFLFFVNSTNIINKTMDNFLNKASSKYLFNDTVIINNERIRIKEVTNFQIVNDDINIVFTTINRLHRRLEDDPKENALTHDDFIDEKIVLISDEAHHINATTKRKNLSRSENDDLKTWESTINKIFTENVQNILLEFTATVDLNKEAIKDKYRDKLLFDYSLKDFRNDKYSKEVKVLQSEIPLFERALQAIILSQFRRKIFEKNGLLIKPVILFKSKIIDDSINFLKEFNYRIKTLKSKDLKKIKNNKKLDKVLKNVFKYFDDNKISLENLAFELREEFAENKCISFDTGNETREKELAINNLEDKDNEYRAIFAVNKLNEGWDVLNLFDIVRLYNTRDAKNGKPGKTTMSEAQLIGRGARYCPFRIHDDQELYKRKYDTRILGIEYDNLKLCEELYYHSKHNPKYIQELNYALEEIGIKSKYRKELQLTLKPSFKDKVFYKEGFVYANELIINLHEEIKSIDNSFINTLHKVSLDSGYQSSDTLMDFEITRQVNKIQQNYDMKSFGMSVIKKALSKLPAYRFTNLKTFFPHLESVTHFIQSNDYLGKIRVELTGSKEVVSNLSQENKLTITLDVLNKLMKQLKTNNIKYKGSKDFELKLIKDVFYDKMITVTYDDSSNKEHGIGQSKTTNPDLVLDLSNEEWYAFNENYGTDQEKYMVKYIYKFINELKKTYSQIYLLRNERHFKIYSFDKGLAFEPDFVLFLVQDDLTPILYYQVFIEPKGKHLLADAKWKQDFLGQLKAEHRIEKLCSCKKYILWGMPLYNDKTENEFNKEFQQLIK